MSSSSSSSSSDDEYDDDMMDLFMVKYALESKRLFVDRNPCRTSMLSGKNYIIEVLVGNPTRCFESFRMKPHVFMNLCVRLKMMGVLEDTKDVSAEEGLAMGLSILCQKVTQRTVAERFQHSTGTVHYWFKLIIRALAALGTELIKPVNRGAVQPEIQRNPKWFPYFKNCIGAIDGTHVAAWSPASTSSTFRGKRTKLVTQNVLAACSQDMMFTFVYTGWEGTAHDSRVFLDALTREGNGFPMPPKDHYYVVDAGYPNIPGFLAPYRGERYHFDKTTNTNQRRIKGKYELFNYRHSSLRNVIERVFGVWKTRFPILKFIPNYPLRRQKLIPIACCTLHNFIRMEDRADELFTQYGKEGLQVADEVGLEVAQEGIEVDMSQQGEMGVVREAIANQMWSDYNRRGRN
ncbi:hypothetical protein ACHQM5_030707 [Ranunculus cassubicifolius]